MPGETWALSSSLIELMRSVFLRLSNLLASSALKLDAVYEAPLLKPDSFAHIVVIVECFVPGG